MSRGPERGKFILSVIISRFNLAFRRNFGFVVRVVTAATTFQGIALPAPPTLA